jgi:hypothetical protein
VGSVRFRGVLVAAVVACVTVPAASGALPLGTTSTSAVAANEQTYQDSTGENPQGPDITTLRASNDDAGMISLRVDIPNRPTLGQDMALILWLDTDNNQQTGATADSGDPPGTDYVIELIRGEVQLYRWDGTGFTRRFGDPSSVTLTFAYSRGVTFRISRSELGNTSRFRFYVFVVSGLVLDQTTGAISCGAPPCPSDDAPGGGVGLYPYEVRIGRASLVVRSLRGTPAAPRAGQSFTLRLVAARSDTNAVVQNGRVTCVGRAGSTRLRVALARVQGGAAVCTWQIPANARGRSFRGSVAVVFEGLRASRSFTARIR